MLNATKARFRTSALVLSFLAVCLLLAMPSFAGGLRPRIGAPVVASFLSATWPVVLAALLTLLANPATYACVGVIIFLLFVKGHLYEQKVRGAIRAAFNIVEDLKAQGAIPAGASKAVVALEQLQALLDTQGITLNAQIVTLAKLMWSSFHGEEKSKINTAALG